MCVCVVCPALRMTLYASCLEGSDPVRLFEKRLTIRRGNVSRNLYSWLNAVVVFIGGKT